VEKVWSPWIRLIHWGLAIGFVYQFFNESGEDPHEWLGYALGTLIVLRWLYGRKAENPHEKWERFKVSPAEFWRAFKRTCRGRMPRELGHPPQAAFVMAGMFVLILLTVLTGHIQEIYFFFGEDWAHNLHRYLAYTALGLVILHVLGVFHASWVWKENLVGSMLHGRRRKTDKNGL
jgi:cytochrome b